MTTKRTSVPLTQLGTAITRENIHEHAGEDAAPLRDSLEDLLQLPPPAPKAVVDVGALAAVWAALEGHMVQDGDGDGPEKTFDHVRRLLADEDLRWVLENRPRAALKWLAHLLDELLDPKPVSDDIEEAEEEDDDLDEGDDGLEALDRDTIRTQLDAGQMEALHTGRGAWYLSGRPRARASREAAQAACRLWAALETSLLRDFERREIQPLFTEFRALCQDRHFQQVLEACPEAAAKWFHALTFQEDDESVRFNPRQG